MGNPMFGSKSISKKQDLSKTRYFIRWFYCVRQTRKVYGVEAPKKDQPEADRKRPI
jgi:hypothetical protein